MDLSVIIPARNEEFLQRTIDDILSNFEGDTEIIAILDGYWPDPGIPDHPRLTLIHHTEAVGQRAATNEGVRLSRAKYIMKCDAHCAFDKGFDVKLMADCEPDWTVIPRMYNLHAFDWVCACGKRIYQGPKPDKCSECGGKMIKDVVWKPRKSRRTDFTMFDENMKFQYWQNREKHPDAKHDIADVLGNLGACFFMERKRFWDLEGLDENHGSWGQLGTEISCKSWLSGGRQVVNKKTWFSHMFRTRGDFSFPYPMKFSAQEAARKYSRGLWLNDKWPKAKHSLSWLIDRFAPVPTWHTDWKPDLTLIYYTANKISEKFAQKIRKELGKTGYPIISVSQKPIDFGTNICVGEIGRSFQNIYRQVLEGAKKATSKYVALVEDDCVYAPEHFKYRPKNAFGYNLNRWNLDTDKELFYYIVHKKRPLLSQCIAPRKLLIKNLEERFALPEIPQKYCGEMGVFEKRLGMKKYRMERFETKIPNVVINHKHNISGRKYITSNTTTDLKPWGNAAEFKEKYMGKGVEVSVIIPARNEKYLQATIDDIFKNFKSNFEIIVGLDAYLPDPPLRKDPGVRVFHSKRRVGMRPMINILAKKARGKYLLKTDAHCSFDDAYDRKLIDIHVPGYTLLGIRFELDVIKWERKTRTNCDFRYLSHPDVDPRGGLRGLAWHEWKKKTKGQKVAESMSLSGSGWLMEKKQFDAWGGLDENHGTFGQEGAEIACKTWLSGGRLLINRNTWYAHWNRGKAPYALSRKQRDKSVDYSIEFWMNDKWPLQKYSFNWLIEHFAPVPGWPEIVGEGIKSPSQGTMFKGNKKLTVDELWKKRTDISEPLKRWRLSIFFKAFGEVIDNLIKGKEYTDEDIRKSRYHQYLVTHLSRNYLPQTQDVFIKKWDKYIIKKFRSGINLFNSIKKKGMLSPLEFYHQDNKLILWRGYRRLVVIKKLGFKRAPVCMYKNPETCKQLPKRFVYRKKRDIKTIQMLAAEQFAGHQLGATDKHWVHEYTVIYDNLFKNMRNGRIKLLEFGVLRGASLKLWHDAFPKGRIYGVDKNVSSWKEFTRGLKRIKVFVGMQEDVNFLNKVSRHGKFSIILDDCGHQPEQQVTLFNRMWPSLAPHGYYIIEDCFRSYLPKNKGKNVPEEMTKFVKNIYTDFKVLSVQFYYNLCVIQKGIE